MNLESKSCGLGLIAAMVLLLTGCNYDVALTAKPTRKIDARLIGDWIAVNSDEPKKETMQVRQLDDSDYVVAMDGDLYRAFHSDFADVPFVSVQNLQPGTDDRKYVYFTWVLSAGGTQLSLQGVSTKVVPAETKGRAAIQKLIKANLADPQLFTEELHFTRK